MRTHFGLLLIEGIIGLERLGENMVKRWRQSIKYIFFGLIFCMATISLLRPQPLKAAYEEPAPAKLTYITVEYVGTIMDVGDTINLKDLKVQAIYSDGSKDQVEDFTMTGYTIEKEGRNDFLVIYEDKSAKVSIMAKKIVGIMANPNKNQYSIGNRLGVRDLTVTVLYSNGSAEILKEGYEVVNDVISHQGRHDIIVRYKGFETSCLVGGVIQREVKSLVVQCENRTIVQNTPINRDDFIVTAIYEDLSSENINTFTLSNESFADTGKKKLRISYANAYKDIDFEVLENYPTGLIASYTGRPVIVGREFRLEDIAVKVKYFNGEIVETTDFSVHSKKIRYIGDNKVGVYYGSRLSTEIIIPGTEIDDPDFDYISEFSATNGKLSCSVKTAIPRYLPTDCVISKSIKKTVLKKAFKKLGFKKGEYIGFTYEFVNDDDELELPLTIRVTLPDKFDAEHTRLYHTPNRKTIIGCTNKTIIDDHTIEVVIFKTGSYMLVYSEEMDAEEALEEDEAENDYI